MCICRRSGNLGSKPNKHVSSFTVATRLTSCGSVVVALSCLYDRKVIQQLKSERACQDPFKRAEIWLRHRKNANKVEETALWKSLLVSVWSFCFWCAPLQSFVPSVLRALTSGRMLHMPNLPHQALFPHHASVTWLPASLHISRASKSLITQWRAD